MLTLELILELSIVIVVTMIAVFRTQLVLRKVGFVYNTMGQNQSQAQNRNKRLASSPDIVESTPTTRQPPSLQEESLYSCVSNLENVGDIETILKAIHTEPESEDP